MALENKKAEQEPEPVIITPSSTYINPSSTYINPSQESQRENQQQQQQPPQEEEEPASSPPFSSRVRFLLADIASVPGYRFIQWLELVRKRTSQYRSSGFPNHPLRQPTMPLRSISCSQERYRRIPWRLSASMSASDFNIRFGSASVTNISIR